jgi:hypothetical protein
MRLTALATTATLALAMATPAHALVVGGFDDLRVGVTLPGKTAQTTTNSQAGGTTARDAWDSAYRFNVDYVSGWSIPVIGVVAGAGIAGDMRNGKPGGGTTEVEYSAYSGHLRAGPYWGLLDIINVELTGFYGLGYAQLKEKAGGQSTSDGGTYMEYGANIDVVVTVPEVGLQAGAGTGWLVAGSKHDLRQQSGTTTAYEVAGGNWTATVFVGLRF